MKPVQTVRARLDQVRTTLAVVGALVFGLAILSFGQLPDGTPDSGGEKVRLWGPVAIAYMVTGSKWIAGGVFAAIGLTLLLLAMVRPLRRPVGK